MDWKLNRIFYGWWVIGACSLQGLLVAGFIVLGFTAFFEPIADEFGWSYAQISLAASLRGGEVGVLAPLMGLLVDRWGPRRILVAGTIFLGVGLMFLSRTTSLAMFYAGFFILAIGASGCSPTVVMTAAANWFRRKVGIATGIMTLGFAFGGLLVLVVVRLIDVFEWRTAMLILGISMLVIGLPLTLVVRHKPEQYGLLRDGERGNSLDPDEGTVPARAQEVNIGARQALKSRAFWHIGIATTFQLVAITSVLVHVMPYLSSVGIVRSTSSLVAMAVPLTSVVSRIGSGWLIDRFNKQRVAAGIFAMTGLGMLFFTYVSDKAMWLLVPFVILFASGWGGTSAIRAALVSEFFGRTNFGTIFGFMMGMIAIGGILGPYFAGWVFDSQHSYFAAWLVFAALVFAGMIIIATIPQADTGVQSDADR